MILRRTDKTMEKLTLIFKKSFGHKLTLACLGVSILALLPFPYSFYVLIRLIFFVALLWCGWQLYLKDNRIGNLHFIIGGLAILFNPLVRQVVTNTIIRKAVRSFSLMCLITCLLKKLCKRRDRGPASINGSALFICDKKFVP